MEIGEKQCAFEDHEGGVQCVAMNEDGSRVVSGSSNGSVCVWDEEKGEELCEFRDHEYDVQSVAMSGDGSRVVSGSTDKTVRVWDAVQGLISVYMKVTRIQFEVLH